MKNSLLVGSIALMSVGFLVHGTFAASSVSSDYSVSVTPSDISSHTGERLPAITNKDIWVDEKKFNSLSKTEQEKYFQEKLEAYFTTKGMSISTNIGTGEKLPNESQSGVIQSNKDTSGERLALISNGSVTPIQSAPVTQKKMMRIKNVKK